jgi:hypothetical protein
LFLGVLFPEIAAVVPPALAGAAGALAPHATGRSFANFHGTAKSESDRARSWDTATYTRLRDVKKSYDPDSRFAFGHWS